MGVDRINLIPKDLRSSHGLDPRRALAYGWIASAVLLALLTGLRMHSMSSKERALATARNEAAKVALLVEQVNLESKSAEAKTRSIASTRKILDTRLRWTDILKELSLVVPKSVWLTNLTTKLEADKRAFFEIIGRGPSQEKIGGFLEALEGSYHFRMATMKSSQKLPDFAPDLYQFTFEVEAPQLLKKGENAKTP